MRTKGLSPALSTLHTDPSLLARNMVCLASKESHLLCALGQQVDQVSYQLIAALLFFYPSGATPALTCVVLTLCCQVAQSVTAPHLSKVWIRQITFPNKTCILHELLFKNGTGLSFSLTYQMVWHMNKQRLRSFPLQAMRFGWDWKEWEGDTDHASSQLGTVFHRGHGGHEGKPSGF